MLWSQIPCRLTTHHVDVIQWRKIQGLQGKMYLSQPFCDTGLSSESNYHHLQNFSWPACKNTVTAQPVGCLPTLIKGSDSESHGVFRPPLKLPHLHVIFQGRYRKTEEGTFIYADMGSHHPCWGGTFQHGYLRSCAPFCNCIVLYVRLKSMDYPGWTLWICTSISCWDLSGGGGVDVSISPREQILATTRMFSEECSWG